MNTNLASKVPDWGELEGIANRTDYDLSAHAKHSGEDLSYFNQATGEKYVPYVIEPAAGLTRSLMAFLVDAYDVDEAQTLRAELTSALFFDLILVWLLLKLQFCL